MRWEFRWQRRLDTDLLAGNRMLEFQILRVQKISTVARQSGSVFERPAG